MPLPLLSTFAPTATATAIAIKIKIQGFRPPAACERTFLCLCKERWPKESTPCLRAHVAMRRGSTPLAGFFDDTSLYRRKTTCVLHVAPYGVLSASSVAAEGDPVGQKRWSNCKSNCNCNCKDNCNCKAEHPSHTLPCAARKGGQRPVHSLGSCRSSSGSNCLMANALFAEPRSAEVKGWRDHVARVSVSAPGKPWTSNGAGDAAQPNAARLSPDHKTSDAHANSPGDSYLPPRQTIMLVRQIPGGSGCPLRRRCTALRLRCVRRHTDGRSPRGPSSRWWRCRPSLLRPATCR